MAPGMYLGEQGVQALQHMIDEVVSNAIDQYLMGRATMLGVRVLEDGGIEVRDDGPGMPFDVAANEGDMSLATRYFTTRHGTARADDHSPHVHVHLLDGCGLMVVTFCSRRLVCRSWREGRLWHQSFTDGLPDAPPESVEHGEGRSTTIVFHPDAAIVGTDMPSRALLRSTLFRLAHLFPGLQIEFEREIFLAEEGLADYLQLFDAGDWRWKDRPTFHWRCIQDGFEIEAAAAGFGREDGRDCVWRTWVNGRATATHGTHRQGFVQALAQARWRPASVMLHVIAHDPAFAGPTRDKYISEPARTAVRQALNGPLDAYCRTQKIGKYAKE
jgi:DNA gyrase subunit B